MLRRGNRQKERGGGARREEGGATKGPAPSSQQLSTEYTWLKAQRERTRRAWEGLFIRVWWLASPSVLPKWRTSSHHAQQVTSALCFFFKQPSQPLRRFSRPVLHTNKTLRLRRVTRVNDQFTNLCSSFSYFNSCAYSVIIDGKQLFVFPSVFQFQY